MKLTEEEKLEFKKQIQEIIRQRGMDPDAVDIDAAIANPDKPLLLPNGDELSFTEVASPKRYGPYMSALAFLHAQIERYAATVERDFRLSEQELRDEQREDLAHGSLHSAIDTFAIIATAVQGLMPCGKRTVN